MNKRQRKILAHALENGFVTTKWSMDSLEVARDTAHRDLVRLVKLELLTRKGAGRGVKYISKEGTS